jgi:hypothetical protein
MPNRRKMRTAKKQKNEKYLEFFIPSENNKWGESQLSLIRGLRTHAASEFSSFDSPMV